MTNVEEKVNLPGIALIVLGVLALLYGLLSGVGQLIGAFAELMMVIDGTQSIVLFAMGTGWKIVMSLITLGSSLLIIFGGVKLRSLSGAGVVYAASVVALLPCCAGPCCCLGLPIGIWAIVTMQDEDVKAAFQG